MSRNRVVAAAALLMSALAAQGAESPEAIRKLELAGNAAEARSLLARAVQSNPNDVAALSAYAEFLERYGDPGSRDAYRKMVALARKAGDSERAAVASRRLLTLDLLAGDSEAAAADRDALGKRAGAPAPAAESWPTILIPGPLRSFARMAAVPSDIAVEDVLPALARNIITQGYQASSSKEALEPTEYLKLLKRYLSQARELQTLAGEQRVIRIDKCESPNVADLLRALGYRMRGGCGSDVVLETVNAARAFLTTDSGFPIHELEQGLRTNRPFTYDYQATAVPVIFGPEFWFPGAKEAPDFIDGFIADPSLDRLYLGFAKLDSETAAALRKAAPFARLKLYAHVLDFFGGMFEIRDGKAVISGGPRTAAAWGDMVGASPEQGANFFEKLVAKDDGWMASYYDSLARIEGPAAAYLREPARLKRFYAALRGKITSPGPARPVFRASADLMLLTTRLQLDADGKPHVPGNLEVWKNLFVNHPAGKYDGRLTRAASSWKDSDDLVEALFGLCRKASDNQALRIFITITDLDRNRKTPLEPATVDRLAREFRQMGAQYPTFAESRSISDSSIIAFLDAASAIRKIRDQLLEADSAGSYQALVGIWQILVRLQSIPADKADAAFAAITEPFPKVRNSRDLFDAGRNGVNVLLAAAGERSANAVEAQERMTALLVGAPENADPEAREQAARDFQRVLEAQRIVGLDALFQLSDHIEAVARGEKLNAALVNKYASRISEVQPPRASLSAVEKTAMSSGYWTDRHVDAERNLNVRAAIEKAAGQPEKVREVRGLLAPLLRDSLVALNYAYYAPPGAQILYTNPLFVRSHDFMGMAVINQTWRTTEIFGSGWPSNAGGRLAGSLAGLPYALAEAEENFLVPAQTQALIWGDLAPHIIVSATAPRWWRVTPLQVHWVGLHLRYGLELLAESADDPDLRSRLMEILGSHASPARTRQTAYLLARGNVRRAVDLVTPSELFLLARETARPGGPGDSCLLAEVRDIARTSPNEVSDQAISRAFGTPKPTLANSYEPELLHLRTFPTLMGYSSRMLAESWESNTLYWAMLADELHLPPGQLSVRIPEWTRKVVERIFASHLEDWPALLRSLRAVGDEERAQDRAARAAEQKAAIQDISKR